MIEEAARVVDLDGAYAWVEATRQSACGSCASNKGCGTSALSKLFVGKTSRIRVLNQINAEIGEQVVVGLDEAAFLRGSFAMYLAPLVGLIGGGLLGQLGAQTTGHHAELMSALGALTGFALGLLWLRKFSLRVAEDVRYQAIIVRRLGMAQIESVPLSWVER